MKKIEDIDEHKLNRSIDSAIKEGAVYAKFYFDIHGKSEESLKEMATGFVAKIIDYPGVIYAKGEIDEPIEDEGLVSVPMEVNILANDFPILVKLSMDFIPYSVEILKPMGIKLDISQVHDILMDTSTTSFNYRKYIVEKVSSPHDKETYSKTVKNRVALGKRLLGKGDKDES